MNEAAPFTRGDLAELERLYEQARRVIPMSEVADGDQAREALGLRHDVDNEIGSAVDMAVWEAERGIRATYFIEHTAPYWDDKRLLRASLETIAGCGHEIGLHLNAITEAIRSGADPLNIAAAALAELRSYGHEIRGVVAHGDPACYQHGFVNDELFTESARPDWGAPDRTIAGRVKLRPISRRELGLEYDPNWLPRATYLSDSGGRWSQPYEQVAAGFPYDGQLHMLVHPCWWREAFTREAVAA